MQSWHTEKRSDPAMNQFHNSELSKSIESAKLNKEALINKKRYVEMAVTHWEKEQDSSQVEFFSQALSLINKYLK